MPQKNDPQRVIQEIEELLTTDFADMQSWDSLSAWDVGEDILFDEGIKATLVIKTRNHLRFLTMIPPLASFASHRHDVPETCKVLGGVLGDKLINEEYHHDYTCVYRAHQMHQPYNPSEVETCFLQVDFYR